MCITKSTFDDASSGVNLINIEEQVWFILGCIVLHVQQVPSSGDIRI